MTGNGVPELLAVAGWVILAVSVGFIYAPAGGIIIGLGLLLAGVGLR